MGTKNNPGEFDCHAKADADEPLFTLLARDPQAPHLVAIWAAMRSGEYREAERRFLDLFHDMRDRHKKFPPNQRDGDKAHEAKNCAQAMVLWHEKNIV